MKNLIKIIALLLTLAATLSFASCAKMEEFFGSERPIVQQNPDGTLGTISDMDPRIPGLYNFLLIREGATRGEVSTITVAQLNIRDGALSMLHIPENLFASDGETKSLGAVYKKEYARKSALGLSRDECELSGANEVGRILERDLLIPIDYNLVMDEGAIKSYVDILGGVEISLPFDFTTNAGNTFKAGMRTLDGETTYDFLNYDMFENSESRCNALSEVLAGMHKKICGGVSGDNLSIHMVQAKPLFATDVPTKDGYDIFFLRKLISVTSENWKVSTLCTYPVATADGDFEIVRYETALEQLNTFLAVYVDPVGSVFDETTEAERVLDPEGRMTDESQAILHNIYKSQTSLPSVYTADDAYLGRLAILQK